MLKTSDGRCQLGDISLHQVTNRLSISRRRRRYRFVTNSGAGFSRAFRQLLVQDLRREPGKHAVHSVAQAPTLCIAMKI